MLTTGEYTYWVDKLMTVRSLDASRTTSLHTFDQDSYAAGWKDALDRPVADLAAPPLPSARSRIAIYWYDDDEGGSAGTWYTATVKSHRKAQDGSALAFAGMRG